MDKAAADRMSKSLKAVSDVNRIRILAILSAGEYCVSDLVAKLDVDQPKVSHHLAILRQAGVIVSRRQGRHINYSIQSKLHRRVDGPHGPIEVFDLEGLSVSFRFAATAAHPTVTLKPDGYVVADPRRHLDGDATVDEPGGGGKAAVGEAP
jgi:ArsR family transcriptional regulator